MASRPDSVDRANGPAIGVVGVGTLGRHHARAARDLDGAACSGVFDADALRCQEVARRLGVPARSSLEELLAASDGVVVAVPTSAHERVARAAIGAGRHLLVEKPIAPDVAAADRIIAEADAAGVVLQVGHSERYNRAIRAAEPYLERPLFVESHRLAPFVPRSLDVPVVLDLMIHDVDLLCALVEAPVSSVAAVGVSVLTGQVDIANARLEIEGGAVANLTASRVSMSRVRKLRIWQRSGYLSLDLAEGGGEFLRLRDGVSLPAAPPQGDGAGVEGLPSVVERIPISGSGEEPLAAQLESFRRAMLGEALPPVTGPDGRRALRLSLAIQERIEEHVAHSGQA
ncbi:MAG: Gfo/Idh/MocA family oxidoreductase [Gemmatimonadetes bacterium]|nr:Gfo/Idh/MocA family oxidoreductase [Gemmatimonadota bacterium]MCY3943374.1 Gfo/Idh/MocA family oxidoreductase [Gemmatimonadota bacterium]